MAYTRDQLITLQLFLIHLLFEGLVEMSVEVTVEPMNGCICPSQNYTCRANSATTMAWSIGSDDPLTYNIFLRLRKHTLTGDGVVAHFSNTTAQNGSANITSHLLTIEPSRLNESSVHCEASFGEAQDRVTVTLCVAGTASPPANLSVVCESSSAVVSYQPPVYGGRCVDYYVITAVSEEGNVICYATTEELTYNCSVPQGSSANDYNFTVHSVTRGIDESSLYNGSITSDCCLPFPESVAVEEEECGLERLVNVTWQNSHLTSVTPNIIVHSNGGLRYDESASSEESHQLTLNYSVTGLLEISVTFSSHVCSKTTVTQYHSRGVLTGVSVSGTTLIIQSRDCIASPETYRIVATFTNTSTELVNVSFNSTIEHDIGDEVIPDTQYSITVVLVETTSDTVIDEKTTTFTAPSGPEPGVTEAVIPNTGDRVTYIAVGAGVGGGILVVMAGIVVIAVLIVRNNSSKQDPVPSSSEAELKMLGMKSQGSIKDKRYDAPAPALAESDLPPDVVPHPVYADLNTLQREEKAKESVAPVYHVLEGPTPVENTASEMKEALQDCSKPHDV